MISGRLRSSRGDCDQARQRRPEIPTERYDLRIDRHEAPSGTPETVAPAPLEVVPGVWLVRLPLTRSPIGSVNVAVLEHADGAVLVDTGYDDPASWSILSEALAAIGVDRGHVTDVVLTHDHPAHVGLARRFVEDGRARLLISPRGALAAYERPLGSFTDQLAEELRLAGVPEEVAEEMLEGARRLESPVEGPPANRMLVDGATFATGGLELRVLETPGHARGHICLHDERRRLLLGGDLVVGGEIQLGLVVVPRDDPAKDLERSLKRVAGLDVEVTIPGHGEPFGDLAGRASASLAGVRTWLAETEAVLGERAVTAWEVAQAMPSHRPWDEMGVAGRRFAVMQAIGWCRRLVSLRRAAAVRGVPERYSLHR